MGIDEALRLQGYIIDDLERLSAIHASLKARLSAHANGKVLKGNEIVGWLGEIYVKELLDGRLVDDSHDHDVEAGADGSMRISVKARRGRSGGWNRTSAIPRIEGDGVPTHLAFVNLDARYELRRIWLFPWERLAADGRFIEHVVRGVHRSWYVSIREASDDDFLVFPSVSTGTPDRR